MRPLGELVTENGCYSTRRYCTRARRQWYVVKGFQYQLYRHSDHYTGDGTTTILLITRALYNAIVQSYTHFKSSNVVLTEG